MSCENCDRLKFKVENLLLQNQDIASSNAEHVGRLREAIELADHYVMKWPEEANQAAAKILELLRRPFPSLLNEETAKALGDIWADEALPCFICSRPTRYVDICWEGPICSVECDSWACNDASLPKVAQGPRPKWREEKPWPAEGA